MNFYTESYNHHANFQVGFDRESSNGAYYIWAKAYFEMANTYAIRLISDEPYCPDYLAIPVFFNYRHFFELCLKYFLLEGQKIKLKMDYMAGKNEVEENKAFNTDHNLIGLAEKTKTQINLILGYSDDDLIRFCNSFIKTAKSIHNIDSTSCSFRYPRNKHQKKYFSSSQVFCLVSIKEEFERLFTGFEALFSMFSSLDDDLDENIQIQNQSSNGINNY